MVGVEEDVTRRLLAGEAGAEDEFVRVFGRKVFQYSYLNCGRREDAEEVAQETLLKMLQNLGSLRDPSAVKTWAFQIARNTCFTRNRRSEFVPTEELSLDTVPSHWVGAFRDEHPLPDDAAYAAELRRLVAHAIHELPTKYRQVVLLRELEELSVAETAAVLEVSEEVVKTRLHRARAALRKAMERAGVLSPLARQ